MKFTSKPASAIGIVILAIAFALLAFSWVWQEDLKTHGDDVFNVHTWDEYTDSVELAGRLWNAGVLIAVFGSILVAFSEVRK